MRTFFRIETGAFKLYDVDNDGFITRDEMYNIVDAIYQMLGNSSGGSGDGDEEEEDPKDRVDRIFEQLDKVIKNPIYSLSLFLFLFLSPVFLFLQVIKFVEPDFINE